MGAALEDDLEEGVSLSPAEAMQMIDKHLKSPDLRLVGRLAIAFGLVVASLCGAQAVLPRSHFRPYIAPSSLLLRETAELEPEQIYNLYYVYSSIPVASMALLVLRQVWRGPGVTKRNFILCWALKVSFALASTALFEFGVLPRYDYHGARFHSGDLLSSVASDMFYLVMQGSAAPWSGRRLALALVLEVTYKSLGFGAPLVPAAYRAIPFLASMVLGLSLAYIVVAPTRKRDAARVSAAVVQPTLAEAAPGAMRTVLTRDQAMATGTVMALSRLSLGLVYAAGQLVPGASDWSRVTVLGTMVHQLVVPAAFLHLCFAHIDSAVLRLIAAQQRRNATSRIEAQHQIVRWVCHEVRVPLSTVRLGIQDVEDALRGADRDRDDPSAVAVAVAEAEGSLSTMGAAVSRMHTVLDDMLAYEKLQHGAMRVEPATMDLARVAAHVVRQYSQEAAAAGVRLHRRSAPPPPPMRSCACVRGDATRITQLLSNFVSNALKVTGIGGAVSVEYAVFRTPPPGCEGRWDAAGARVAGAPSVWPGARSAIAYALAREPDLLREEEGQGWRSQRSFGALGPASRPTLPGPASAPSSASAAASAAPPMLLVCVRVRDTGRGVAAADQGRLFQPFSQLRAGEEQAGTGLGLAVCRAIAELHGGVVGMSSPGRGKGCEFWVEWASAPGEGDDSRGSGRAPGSGGRSSGGSADRASDSTRMSGTGSDGSGVRAATRDSPASASQSTPTPGPPVSARYVAPGLPSLERPGTGDEGGAAEGTPRQLRPGHARGRAERPTWAAAPPAAPAPSAPPLLRSASAPTPTPAPVRPLPPSAAAATSATAAAAPQPKPPLYTPPLRSNGPLRGLCVAVVDDYRSNRELLAKAVGKRGATVVMAADGGEFLSLLASAGSAGSAAAAPPRIDVVLLDKEMPRVSGYGVLGVLALARDDGGDANDLEEGRTIASALGLDLAAVRRGIGRAPVVGVTANALPEDVAEFRRRGAADVLNKPVDVAGIVATVLDLVVLPGNAAAANSGRHGAD